MTYEQLVQSVDKTAFIVLYCSLFAWLRFTRQAKIVNKSPSTPSSKPPIIPSGANHQK